MKRVSVGRWFAQHTRPFGAGQCGFAPITRDSPEERSFRIATLNSSCYGGCAVEQRRTTPPVDLAMLER
jgi:hypothetical protein